MTAALAFAVWLAGGAWAAAPAAARAAAPAEPAASVTVGPAELLARAEALNTGSGGRYDPAAAGPLFAQAAATGDPLASFRFATMPLLRNSAVQPNAADAATLYARSAAAVAAAAAAGDPYAQSLLGTGFLVGVGGKKDPAAARHWLETAAARDAPWSWHNLGWMQEKGIGYPTADVKAALDLYRRSAEGGNAVSMLDIARLTLTLDGHGERCVEGRRWLERSATAGNLRAAAFLGKLLYYGRGSCVAATPAAALPWLRAAAADDPGARYDLALALLLGNAGVADSAAAVRAFEALAATADRTAVETLAWLYGTGLAVARDPPTSRRWIAEAARLGADGLPDLLAGAAFPPMRSLLDQGMARLSTLASGGDAAAAALLARVYYFAHEAPFADQEKAIPLARQGAAGGEAGAMRILGHAYRHGQGVRQDAAAGVDWWRRGAEAGDSFSMMFYAQAMMGGEVIPQDVATGLAWLIKAGEAGNYWAIGDLGRVYDEGWNGVARDPDKAAPWRRLRAKLGDDEAKGWLLYNGYSPE